MLQLKTILYATDLSESSKSAFPLACSLARDHGAQLSVLHVIPSGTHQFLMLAQFGQGESAAQFEADIRHDLEQHCPAADRVRMEYKLGKGDPANTIVEMAQKTGCDLIVLGTHGRTGLGRVLMGSVAEQVMRTASCPVLVVKGTPS